MLKVWEKTGGKCRYCGVQTNYKSTTYDSLCFSVDHIVPRSIGGSNHISNLAPACRACNTCKGKRDVEGFRFILAMKVFASSHGGVQFTREQVRLLAQLGTDLGLPNIKFWFEDPSQTSIAAVREMKTKGKKLHM